MRILQICKKVPYPLRDGESIAVYNLSRSVVAAGCSVSLLSMNTSKHFVDVNTEKTAELEHYKGVYTVEVHNHLSIWGLVANFFSRESYHATRFRSLAFEQALTKILSEHEFDIIQIETIIPALYIPLIRRLTNARVVLRAHNVEHEIWSRLADGMFVLNPIRWYLRYAARKLKRFELEHLNLCDLLVPITPRDAASFQQFGYKGMMQTIPVGLNSHDYTYRPAAVAPQGRLAFIGSLDWAPNQQGLLWFLKDFWPTVKKHYPHLSLHVAGRNCPKWLENQLRGHVVLHGEVDDAQRFMQRSSLLLVPLMSGSGMRVKILEGMFLGRVVVTTTLGLEGIPAQNGFHVMVADTPDQFLRCLQQLYQSPQLMTQISKQAREFAVTHYDNLHLGNSLARAYQLLTTNYVQTNNN
jgi:glycosyltransferase involved in cell wall biosynthesis